LVINKYESIPLKSIQLIISLTLPKKGERILLHKILTLVFGDELVGRNNT
jgi:hypothetical protein